MLEKNNCQHVLVNLIIIDHIHLKRLLKSFFSDEFRLHFRIRVLSTLVNLFPNLTKTDTWKYENISCATVKLQTSLSNINGYSNWLCRYWAFKNAAHHQSIFDKLFLAAFLIVLFKLYPRHIEAFIYVYTQS